MTLQISKKCMLVSFFIVLVFNMMMMIMFGAYNFHKSKPNKKFKNAVFYSKNNLKKTTGINLDLTQYEQDDSNLIEFLFSQLVPPSSANVPYKIKERIFDTSQGQAKIVRILTKYKSNGFFVECGAGDGEFYSNTLFLERNLNWTGLLIEANPDVVVDLLNVNRKAWVSPFCVSLNTSAYKAQFQRKPGFLGKISSVKSSDTIEVTCFPFFTHLLALNMTNVDYFSLDVEGHEVEVLETIPFNKVNISILSVEFSKSRGGFAGVKKVMERNGYTTVTDVYPDDLIFVKKNHAISIPEYPQILV